jgi:SAM-dependent methyltransferase
MNKQIPPQIEDIQAYWNTHIHDLELARHPVGTPEFFDELESYRFRKLDYLPEIVNFSGYSDKMVLEIGCGLGLDLARFTAGGAQVQGIDLSETAIWLARQHFQQRGLAGSFTMMNGEALDFPDDSFDLIYAHGVLQYTANPQQMISEIYRVMRTGGEAILMVYNRRSWLQVISRLTGVGMEHEDAPAFWLFTAREFREMLSGFPSVTIIPERFPVKTELHHGWKAVVYNKLFVQTFNLLPRSLVRASGWHLMAFVRK